MRKVNAQAGLTQVSRVGQKDALRAAVGKSPLVSKNGIGGRERYRHSEIVMKLIDYVEGKLASRIGLIEQVSRQNAKNLQAAKTAFKKCEQDVGEL